MSVRRFIQFEVHQLFLESVIMKNQIQKFIHDESGATAIEYGLLAALVALGIAVGATALGTQLGALFTRISTRLSTAVFP
jgi:pilus assembly protein Flp/PilA